MAVYPLKYILCPNTVFGKICPMRTEILQMRTVRRPEKPSNLSIFRFFSNAYRNSSNASFIISVKMPPDKTVPVPSVAEEYSQVALHGFNAWEYPREESIHFLLSQIPEDSVLKADYDRVRDLSLLSITTYNIYFSIC